MSRRALVTGVSRGIGRAVAGMLLAEGWKVLGVSRSRPKNWQGGTWLSVDVSSASAIEWMMANLPERHRPLDALIHCAAIQGPVGPIAECDPAEWRRTIEVNLIGAHNVVRALLPSLHQSDDARILLFSGGGAFNGRPFHTAYAASKAGVVSLMETLADELRDTTVSVNCIAPGYVPTGIHGPDVRPDRGEAMAEAVACVRHLLSPQTRGLTGKTVSAPHDDWRAITGPLAVAAVNASTMGARRREPIAMVTTKAVALAKYGERVLV